MALPGMEEMDWFDQRHGTVVNQVGRVEPATDQLGGLYVSGWLKRGPNGIIGTNIVDAKNTVVSIMEDLKERKGFPAKEEPSSSLSSLLRNRGVQVVDWSAYQRINAVECEERRKRDPQQPREKLVDREELLRVALES
mmetsp:Transcript_5255/g.11708  ORF Transcript_5255/g.11708 Transcript_5255/m.11708 type:complete len:138 (-) Transcript_5255:48-461(-)